MLQVKKANDKSSQGGPVNQGYTPLQNSGQGGKGYAANLQPASSGLKGAINRSMFGKKLRKKSS